eukprot:366248-Chlamydomonas_euryale.AAC.2
MRAFCRTSLGQLPRAAWRPGYARVLPAFEAHADKSSGNLCPGAKGVALTPEEWAALAPALRRLAEAADAGQAEAPTVELGRLRRAYLSAYGGRRMVHVREMYEQHGRNSAHDAAGMQREVATGVRVEGHAPCAAPESL